MKNSIIILFVLFFGIALNGFSQTEKPVDFFAGKWELTFIGTPEGDGKLIANIVRKDGKLSGDLTDPKNPEAEKILITNIIEEADKIEIFFSASGYDVSVDLTKVDNDNLKGSLMNMFESKAVRIK